MNNQHMGAANVMSRALNKKAYLLGFNSTVVLATFGEKVLKIFR